MNLQPVLLLYYYSLAWPGDVRERAHSRVSEIHKRAQSNVVVGWCGVSVRVVPCHLYVLSTSLALSCSFLRARARASSLSLSFTWMRCLSFVFSRLFCHTFFFLCSRPVLYGRACVCVWLAKIRSFIGQESHRKIERERNKWMRMSE